jgi:hypothetical protein
VTHPCCIFLSHRHRSPDNTFEVFVNGESSSKGSLLEDFEPPVNPSKEIDDPEDKKPEDWVEQAKIADPSAKKVCFFIYSSI